MFVIFDPAASAPHVRLNACTRRGIGGGVGVGVGGWREQKMREKCEINCGGKERGGRRRWLRVGSAL